MLYYRALALFLVCFILSTNAIDIQAKSCKNEPKLISAGRCMTDEEYTKLGDLGQKMRSRTVGEREPIILVPGLGGSALEAKLENAKEPFFLCCRTCDWSRIWLSLGSLVPGYIDCWFHNMGIAYDKNTNTYHNHEGITMRPIDFGGLSGIDYMDYVGNSGLSITSYFAPMIKNLVSFGYEPGVDLRGLPFDWRKPGDAALYASIKELVEDTYKKNNNKRVNFVAHSFGNIQTALFLQSMTAEWRQKHIASFISLAAPWRGAPQALRAVISGDDFGIGAFGVGSTGIDKIKVRTIAREAGGVVMLTPSGDSDEEIIYTPEKTYRISDIPELLVDIGAPLTANIREKTFELMETIETPDVELHCLYGINQLTEKAYTYSHGFESDPEIIYTEYGDGIVSGDSLKVCEEFKKNTKHSVDIKEFDLANHMTILDEEEVLEYILKTATSHGN